jgi:2-polyprenyl-6-methoxyphenol hydroxylase-like FAD-dependent oxidoreductase
VGFPRLSGTYPILGNIVILSITLTDSISHWKTDQVVSTDTHTNVPDPRHHTTRFHRSHLHSALLEHVPRESVHLGKRIVRAEANREGVSLYFEDGSSAHGDVLIGADGIRSVCDVRLNGVVLC